MDLFSLLILLAVYSILILVFVPLEKIGTWQTKVKAAVKKISDKVKD